MWKVVQLEKYFDFSLYSHHFSLLSLTSPLSAPEREVTFPSDFKVVGALLSRCPFIIFRFSVHVIPHDLYIFIFMGSNRVLSDFFWYIQSKDTKMFKPIILGYQTTRTETSRPVSENKSARKRGLVGPYVKTTRIVWKDYSDHQ